MKTWSRRREQDTTTPHRLWPKVYAALEARAERQAREDKANKTWWSPNPESMTGPDSRGNFNFRCINHHPDRNPSLAVHPIRGFICRTCSFGGGIGKLARALEVTANSPDPVEGKHPPAPPSVPAAIIGISAAERARHLDSIIRLWHSLIPDTGRIAEYLRSRGLSGRVPPNVQLAQGLGFYEYYEDRYHLLARIDAMILPVYSAEGKLITFHRIYLDPNGAGKFSGTHPITGQTLNPKKLMPSPIPWFMKGAAIRFAQPAETLHLAEGPETALAVLEATDDPAWSTIHAEGMAAVGLPSIVRTVYFWPTMTATP